MITRVLAFLCAAGLAVLVGCGGTDNGPRQGGWESTASQTGPVATPRAEVASTAASRALTPEAPEAVRAGSTGLKGSESLRPAWSLDGSKIAFQGTQDGGYMRPAS